MKHTKKLFIAFLLLFANVNAFTQDNKIDSMAKEMGDIKPPESIGDTTIKINDFDAYDSMQGIKSDRDFAYMKYLDSLLRKTKDLTVDTFSIYNATSSGRNKKPVQETKQVNVPRLNIFNQPIVKIILWVLAVFLIGFIIWKLFLSQNLFKRKRGYVPAAGEEKEEEDLSDPSAYDQRIAQAVMNKNYRLAIRYSYLQTLKKLSGIGLLQYAADKTNYQYVNELRGKPYQNDFASLTLNYEYIWYGRFDITEEVYGRLAIDYKNFNQKMQRF